MLFRKTQVDGEVELHVTGQWQLSIEIAFKDRLISLKALCLIPVLYKVNLMMK